MMLINLSSFCDKVRELIDIWTYVKKHSSFYNPKRLGSYRGKNTSF
jgi:hypothetical protein